MFTTASSCKRAKGLMRFATREDGSMTIFGVFMLLCMLAIVGIGVDIMRHESVRANLQATLDRAVLAAADMEQPLPPEQVVADYFNKAGLGNALSSVQVTEGLTSRRVTASAQSNMNTFFMKWTGVDELSVASTSTAEEAIDFIEISLVLDVSGSMGSNNRLTNLKVAAKDFVDEIFDNSVDDTVTMSIIPYATQVSLPEEMFEELDVTAVHDYSHCIDFQAADFNDTQITPLIEASGNSANSSGTGSGLTCENGLGNDTGCTYEQTMHFDPFYIWDGRSQNPQREVLLPVCHSDPSREIMPISGNRQELKDYIDTFYAGGNTSLDLGMKWGSVLLDPSFRPITEELVDEGLIDAEFENRPAAHQDGETIKIVVLMTDGQNTSQYFMEEPFREGDSPIWWNDEAGAYSVYLGQDLDDDNGNGLTNDPLYFWPQNANVPGSNSYQDHAYGEGVYETTETNWECQRYRRNGTCRRWREVTTTITVDEPGTAEVLLYPDLWASTSVGYVADKFFTPIVGSTDAWADWYNGVINYVGWSEKNARTQQMCDSTKQEGVIVYTIGFEAPDASRNLLRNCASSPAHYFDVDGLEISDAFSAIASSIRSLRLTQ